MATVYMICQATVGNCVRIGMIVPKDAMFFGAALGVALHTTFLWIAASSLTGMTPNSAGFDVWQD